MDMWLYRELVEEGYDITQRYPYRPRNKEDPLEATANRHSESCELRRNASQYTDAGRVVPPIPNHSTAAENIRRYMGNGKMDTGSAAGGMFESVLSHILNMMSTHTT